MTDLDLSGRMLGEFMLHERIGSGGHGTVYRCEQPALARDAVVKVLHARRESAAAQARFAREAQLASRLDHPYAAHVYSFGIEDDGLRWIAMELVHGITLGEWLKSRGPMSFAQFVPFFDCVTQVVQAAHERGIVHRDLKPSNIMVLESGGALFPKLLDFGIAKLHEDRDPSDDEAAEAVATVRLRAAPPPGRTNTDPDREPLRLTPRGAVLGSAPYMSPEQWVDPFAVGPATDIYSLGCVAYEALTGRAPFTAAKIRDYCDRHVRGEPPPLGADFPPGLDKVLRRALAKSAEARHGSALELAAELRAVLRAEPREQLRSSAQQWHDRARPPGLLWGRDVLADVERSVPSGVLSELECSFVAASQRRARRGAWARRSLIALVAIGAIGGLQYRSATQTRLAEDQARLAEQETRSARQLAEARITESELEQGRSALLHGEPEAQAHLTEAYKRDPSPSTAFMLARSMQPRLAEQARFTSTYGRMWWATFSPDGSQIATADDRAAQIWDGKTYRLLLTLPHGCEVYQAVYSADGAKLVTVAETMIRIWDARSGALLRDLRAKPGGTPSDFYRAAVSPDGKFVAAMDTGGSMAWVWDTERGELVTELHNRRGGVPRLAFSPAGWLATTGGEEARVFDVRTWKQVLFIRGPVRSLAFDTRSRLVTGSATGEVALWTVPSGTRLQQLRQFGESADAVAFSPDGQFVAAGSRDGAIQAWQVAPGSLRIQLNPRHSKILCIEFDAASKRLLAANADGTVVVIDVAQGLAVAVLDGPQNVVRIARFDAGSRVVGASWDGTARVWEAAPPYRRWSSPPAGDSCNIGMGARSDRRFIAIGCKGLPTKVWDTSRDQLLAELPNTTPVEAGGFISASPAVSSAGDLAAIARGTSVQVYELPGGRLFRTLEHGAAVSAIAFADSGRAVVSGALDGSVRVLRDDGTELALQASGGVGAVALMPDGRVIITDSERRLRVYDTAGTVLANLELPVRIMSLRRDNARLVALPNCLSNAAPPLLIDLESYRVNAQLEGHLGCVFSASWVPAGRVLTAGADGTARLWSGETGQLLRTYRGGPRFLADVTLTPNDIVIAGDADGQLRLWDAGSGDRLWTFPAHKSAVIGIHVALIS